MTCATCNQPTENVQCLWCRHQQRVADAAALEQAIRDAAAAVLSATLKTFGHACCPNP